MHHQAKIFMYHEHETEAERYVIEQACHFYLNELLPIKQRRMTIHLYFNEKIECDNPKIEPHAEIDWVDTNILPNEYQIRFSKHISKNILRVIKTMAHEMIHVKQFAKGELYDHIYKYTVRWKKINHKNIDESDYFEKPWEIEAFSKEFPLFKKFMKTYGLSQKMIRENPILCAEKIQKVLAS